MKKIVVYFNNNNKLEHPNDKTLFSDKEGRIFSFSENEGVPAHDGYYSDIVREGKILINWENVSFVKFVEGKEEKEQDD